MGEFKSTYFSQTQRLWQLVHHQLMWIRNRPLSDMGLVDDFQFAVTLFPWYLKAERFKVKFNLFSNWLYPWTRSIGYQFIQNAASLRQVKVPNFHCNRSLVLVFLTSVTRTASRWFNRCRAKKSGIGKLRFPLHRRLTVFVVRIGIVPDQIYSTW